MEYTDERLLIEALKKGEKEAFLYLVDRYNHLLFGYALTLTNDSVTAEDILQNVFLRTWEKRKKLNITSSLQNYLFRAVYHEFINQYKKRRSTMLLEQKYFESLERAVQAREESQIEGIIALITKEIQLLPPKCQEVFRLSREDGLTNLEISDHLDISVKTVEAHITKAFGILRSKLGNKYHTIVFLLFRKTRKII